MLYPPTCPVWYGRLGAWGFPGAWAPQLRLAASSRVSALVRRADLPALRPTCFHGASQNPACVPFSVAPSVVAVPRRVQDVRLLRIGYAFRPRLPSSRRTGRISLARKPCFTAARVSAPARYSCSILTPLRSTVGRPPASPRRGSSLPITFPPLRASASPVNCRRMSTDQ